MTLEGIGEVGGGIFFPTGADGDASGTSPALHLNAVVGFSPHWGMEVEYGWVPIQMKTEAFFPATPDAFHIDASQKTALAGFRVTSGHLLDASGPVVGYGSLRAGFARLKIETNDVLGGDGWIARDRSLPSVQSAASEVGFVLSPKAGVMFRLGERSALDIALQQVSIFDQGEVNSHVYLTVSFAMAAWQRF